MPETLRALAEVQRELLTLAMAVDEQELRTQYHPELSPLGWHLGHCAFIERFWVRKQVLGEPIPKTDMALYLPEFSPKPARGARLPAADRLMETVRGEQQRTLQLLAAPPSVMRRHPLMREGFLVRFLLQHHAQHLETMRMVLCQKHLDSSNRAADAGGTPGGPSPRAPRPDTVHIGGEYMIGNDSVGSFDNERPARLLRLNPAAIARLPVSNAEYLGFIEDGGYANPRWWDPAALNWLQRQRISAPTQWVRDGGGWLEIGPDGATPLDPDDAVSGLSWFEADAFARWAGARLPHEYEWEAAAQRLHGVGRSWEWCANRFHPYPGFVAHPYAGYSLPWFDGSHHTLRGGSRHSHRSIRRPSFRNFYGRDKRHIFAGLRLAFD